MMLDIFKGLQFIHSSGILHRDLKSPNLLVDRSWNIKVYKYIFTIIIRISTKMK